MRSSCCRAIVVALAAHAAIGCSHTNDTGGASGFVAPAPVVVATAAAETAPTQAVDPTLAEPPAPGKRKEPEPRVTIAPVAGITLNRPGAVALAPPPLRAAPALPALPTLPAPSAYPRIAIPSGGDFRGCGQVWTGSEWVPVECLAPNMGTHRSAEVVIAYDKMRPPVEQLPAMVDHRADGTEGPIRHQGGPECTTFALTSALDHAYARWTGTPGAFSTMQVWGRYHKKQEQAAATASLGDVISNEALWPYDAKISGSWKYCHGDEKPGDLCNQPVDEAKLREVDKQAIAVVTKVEVIPLSELGVLREKLAAGNDVIVTLHPPSFGTAGTPGSKYVLGISPKDPTKKKGGEHTTLLVGYAMTPNGTYYLVHNSWGLKWGDQGYAWLHEDYLRAFWASDLAVIPYVEPLQVANRRADAQTGLSAACAGDQVPDSISGACAPRCPDGSPRHNDVCARAGECLRGQVNLTGECLLAAPTGSGVDPASGVRWACGPGGCTYTMAKGVQSCVERECAVSCPAPDFRLATTPRGFVCVD